MKLTQKIVRELVDYDPVTGHFYWRKREQDWFASYRSQCSWNAKFAGKRAFTSVRECPTNSYYVAVINWHQCYAHQIAFLWMTGRWPEETDHKNGNGQDNRWQNLREVTRSGNQHNRKRSQNLKGRKLKFKYIGVHQLPNGTFQARLTHQGKYIHLGTFATEKEAGKARQMAQSNYGFSARHGQVG